MYFEKLSLTALENVIKKTLDCDKKVFIRQIKTETLSKDLTGDVFQLNIDFEVCNSIFIADGVKKGTLTMSEYFVLLDEFDGQKYEKFDIDLITKYQSAMIEELKKVDPYVAEDYEMAVEFGKRLKLDPKEDKEF